MTFRVGDVVEFGLAPARGQVVEVVPPGEPLCDGVSKEHESYIVAVPVLGGSVSRLHWLGMSELRGVGPQRDVDDAKQYEGGLK